MDFVTHGLSGLILANEICETPEQKIAVVIGSIIPDLPFSPFYFALKKKIGVKISDLTEAQFVEHAETIRPWRPIYLLMHSLLLLVIVASAEWLIFNSLYFVAGMSLHIFYDLFTHKYNDQRLNPRPLYPFTNWSFPFGFINGWKTGMKGNLISWIIHGIILYILWKPF